MPVEITMPPPKGQGRPSKIHQDLAQDLREKLVGQILKIRQTIDFSPSARGWCYMMEPHGLKKGEFERFQNLMAKMKKSGALPLNISSEDEARKIIPSESIDCATAEEEAESIQSLISNCIESWTPYSFWDDKEVFLLMLVEKIDLVKMFQPLCDKYHIPIANARGWNDLHGKANLIKTCRPHIDAGRQSILLYCGDFDPAGLSISNSLQKNFLAMHNLYNDPELEPGSSGIADYEYIKYKENDIIVKRFGLNYDQIDKMGLSWVDNLQSSKGKFLNDPDHNDFKQAYVQDYIRDYCEGYLGDDGFYHTDMPRKCEANALLIDIDAARQMCEHAILECLDDDASVVDRYEVQLEERRNALRNIMR